MLLTTTMKQVYAGRTTTVSGQTAPDSLAVFLRPKFHYGRDNRPKYKTFGEYASRLTAVVESRLPVTTGKVLQLNCKEAVMAIQSQGATAPTVFQFQENNSIRVIMIDDAPWFVADDVCSILEHSNSRMAIKSLDDDEKDVSIVYTLGGEQQLNIINESGLYSLILTSRKPEAKKFKRWVTSEVLPTMHKTGQYQMPAANQYATEYISNAQYHELKHLVWLIGNSFHHPGGGTFAAWRVLRQELGCEVAAKLPAEHFETAKARLEQIEKQSTAFKRTIMDAERKFMSSQFKTEPDWAALEQDAKRLGLE